MDDIFKPHEECPQPRTVLIEGDPGIGKTTYCNKLAYDWATKLGTRARGRNVFREFFSEVQSSVAT